MNKTNTTTKFLNNTLLFGAMICMCFIITPNVNAADEIVAKDLYKNIYEEMKTKPTETALKNTSNSSGYSEEDLKDIVNGANLSALINKNPNADQLELNEIFSNVLNSYERELDVQTLKSEIESAMKPSEIFSDGDLTNSDFDLLIDLQTIEIILFRDSAPSQFGGEFILDPDVKKKIEDELAGIEPDVEIDIDKLNKDNKKDSNGADSETSNTEEENSGINPLACFDGNGSLTNALENFDKEQEESGSGTNDGSKGDSSGNGDKNGSGVGNNKDDGGDYDPLKAEEGDWPSSTLCPDGAPVCIEINFGISSGGTTYSPKNNCIACHIEMLNKELENVLGHPLSANKLTGNLLEVPKCKTAISSLPLDMNIITVAVPAAQQANQDIYKKSDIGGEWQKLLESVNLFLYEVRDGETQIAIEPITIQSEGIKKAASNLSPDGSISELGERSSDIIEKKEDELANKAIKNEQENRAGDKNLYFQTIINELNDMNRYFTAFKDKIEKMKVPCQRLKNKPSC